MRDFGMDYWTWCKQPMWVLREGFKVLEAENRAKIDASREHQREQQAKRRRNQYAGGR